MDWNEYREKVEKLGKALSSDSRFRVETKVYIPFSHVDFDDLEEAMRDKGLTGAAIWPSFRDFYSVANGFRLQWQYLGQNLKGITTGSAQIAMLQAIYLPEGAPADVINRIYQEPRILDDIGPDDHVAIQLRQSHEPPELLYFADITKKYHPLSLDFESYLLMLLEARAMYGWQQFFVSDPGFPLSEEGTKEFHSRLQVCFPDADVSKFILPTS
jgi:hypothetical protein